jgi:hypothetical protein
MVYLLFFYCVNASFSQYYFNFVGRQEEVPRKIIE